MKKKKIEDISAFEILRFVVQQIATEEMRLSGDEALEAFFDAIREKIEGGADLVDQADHDQNIDNMFFVRAIAIEKFSKWVLKEAGEMPKSETIAERVDEAVNRLYRFLLDGWQDKDGTGVKMVERGKTVQHQELFGCLANFHGMVITSKGSLSNFTAGFTLPSEEIEKLKKKEESERPGPEKPGKDGSAIRH